MTARFSKAAWLPLCTAALLVTSSARGQDRFEIQVYDSETATPGSVGLELHVNHVLSGSTEASAGELPTQHLTHLTLEPHLGLTDWAELGGYLQSALTPDGAFRYGGVKLRLKLRSTQKVAELFGFGINFELSVVPRAFEANPWGSEIRPIADVHWKRLYASFNPIFGIDLAGPLAGRPQFEPAAKVALDVLPKLMLGAEYYGGLGPVWGGPGTSGPAHFLFGALDFTSAWFDLNAGFGYGLAGDERWVAKVILGFHPPEDTSHPPAG